jgi:hypothetical protein
MSALLLYAYLLQLAVRQQEPSLLPQSLTLAI